MGGGVAYAGVVADTRIIYIGDPLCSWCWGIAPELERLGAMTTLPLDVVVGGLRPGPSAERMTPGMEAFLADHWRHVEERTGQPFDHSVLRDHTWTYDTEPACKAVVTMRRSRPDDTLRFFTTIQRAFYAERTLVGDPEAFRPLLAGFPVDPDAFLRDMASPSVTKETWRDFSWARAIGVNAFPVVILEESGQLRPLAMGYTPADTMFERLVSALPAEVAAACTIGEVC